MGHSPEEMEEHLRTQRKQLRRALKTIRLEIDGLGSSFDATSLLDLGIKCSAMSLKDKDFSPQYFEPYQAGIKMPREDEEAEEYIQESFPTLEHEVCEEELESDYKTAYHLQSHVFNIISLAILPQENECPPGVHDKQPGPFHFRTIYESRVPSWETKAVGEVLDETLPHIKCMISIAGLEDGNSKALLRGELIVILSIMEQRLRNERLCTYLDAPVLLFTFRDSMVCAIEANLEGGQLVLRVTKWYDFKQEAEDFTLSLLCTMVAR